MIGWARLLYTVQRPVLLWMTRKLCVPSLDYVLPLAHIWSYIMIRCKQDKVLDPGATLPRN